MRQSRLPLVLAMIERVGLDAFLEAETGAVKTRPVPMRLADSLEKGMLQYGPRRDRGKLTPHEVRVLSLCAQGLTRQEVAKVLGCSTETVKSHLRKTYWKLGAANRSHALALATEQGYLS